MRNWLARSFSLVLLLGLAAPAQAGLAFDALGGGLGSYSGTGSAGYTFKVNASIVVTELNMYAGVGLASATTPVGIWDSVGTLLTSAVIDNVTPQTTTPSAGGGNFNGAFITQIILSPGNYTIAAFGSGADTARVNPTFLSIPEVTYGIGVGDAGASLAFPTSSLGFSLLGPSFQATAVPEPSTLTMLAGGTLACIVPIRRRLATRNR
ncbi:MAG: hypothetical protein SFX72_06230 [Isosphaeraceae bacterium]|nr:hypothetical protein [Isosphaeraceae bacterium]